jgi:hypothetical protein
MEGCAITGEVFLVRLPPIPASFFDNIFQDLCNWINTLDLSVVQPAPFAHHAEMV